MVDSSGLITADAALPQTLLIVPIQVNPIYPGLVAPIVLTREKDIETIEEALENTGVVGLLLERDGKLADVGAAVRILRRLNTTDGGTTILVQSIKRFKVAKIVREEPFRVVQVDYIEDITERSMELDALVRSVVTQVKKLSETNPFFSDDMKLAMINSPGAGVLADIVAFALALKKDEAQEFLETYVVRERFEKLLFHLQREQEVADLQRKINDDVSQKVHRMQREFFLREQMKTIRHELGGEEEGGKAVEKLRERIEKTSLSEEARKAANEELTKLEAMSDASPEATVSRNYLEWMLSLPWGVTTNDNLDLANARNVLDDDHEGLRKVKDRIIEFLAVRQLNPSAKGSVLCFVGPPGVGKTSLGKSIARAMGRKFFRFSLGGMRDEAEIKGHRRTYIGAMPGKILNAMKRAGSQNPVILLDEVDKLGVSFQGDPASALLEVLDPEQNAGFLDHYLDVQFDLSKVMFVLTANTSSTIPPALLDRMEVVELPGYTLEEKLKIARKHVLPRALESNGLRPELVEIPDETLQRMLLSYAREPGMRSMQQLVGAICRKVATRIVETHGQQKVVVKPEDLYDYLGPERFENEILRRGSDPGVVVGLAWTPLGGDILFIEASDVPRRIVPSAGTTKAANHGFGDFKLTGQLGEVMIESASIAYSYVKKKTRGDRIARLFFDNNDIHVHVPAGAIPKDGPSAGVTMATALLSLVTARPARTGVAMTGELSLTGRVLPVGGIREKVLAARRAGVHTVILPKNNAKDLKEIPKENLEGMTFVFADRVEEVFDAALEGGPSRRIETGAPLQAVTQAV